MPPMGVKESLEPVTDPVEVCVEPMSKRVVSATPKRVSLPSMFPLGWYVTPAWATAGLPHDSAYWEKAAHEAKSTSIVASKATPWRMLLTILPYM